jgi:glutathione S-transferase
MPTASSPALQIWGRANSVNVQKVLWCCRECDAPFTRTDAGMQYGRTQDADYLAMNPNGRIPTLVDGDFVLWESNAIMRYIALTHSDTSLPSLYPAEAKTRSRIERWLDWTLSTLQPIERPLFWGLVRTPPAERDMRAMQQAADAAAVLWQIVDRQLASGVYMEGDGFSLADVAIGTYARRWLGVEGIARPALPHLDRWFARVSARPGFLEFVAPPMS